MRSATQVLMVSTLLNVLEFHHNKLFDISVLFEGKCSIEMCVSCLYLHKLAKIYFTVLTCSPTGLSSLHISYNRRKQALKFLEISITSYLVLTEQRKRELKLAFSDSAK